MTRVQVMLSDEISNGLSVEQISKKYSIIPDYIKRELNKIEERKCSIEKANRSTTSRHTK